MIALIYFTAIGKYRPGLGDPARLRGNRLVRTVYLVSLLFIGTLQSGLTLAANDVVKTEYQYSAKVLCSLLLPHQDGSLARGTYRTVVNIHNPTDKKIVIVEKVAIAAQLGTPPGPFSVTPFKKTQLGPDGAVQISCGNIAGFFCPINGVCVDFAFLDGFLVIKSPVELDVVGVYTARHTEGDVETIDVEAVQARKVSAAVEVAADDEGQGAYDRVKYPPHEGKKYSNQMCGGIAGFRCPEGQICVDDPTDSCDPANGGADCIGICTYEIKPSQSYPPKTPPAVGPIPDTGISLGETVCFGTCPEYTITAYPNEFYQLNAGQFTNNPGQSTGTLLVGSFAVANAALQAANFNSLPTDITQGSPACGNQVATDLPTATISETTIAGTRTVTYYPGCFQAPDKAALDQLVADLRTALQVETLVTP